VYVCDLPTGVVRCLAPPLHGVAPRARLGASAVALRDGSFLMAGGATEKKNMCDAWVFSPETHVWVPVALQAPPPGADPRAMRDAEGMARALLRQNVVTFPPSSAADGALLFWGGGLYVTAEGFRGQQAFGRMSELVVMDTQTA
jgi:hypothetical protein